MNLKQLRKSKKLTQAQAAELCGLSRKGYQNLEEGKYKKKNSNTLLYCVAALEEYSTLSSTGRKLSAKDLEKTLVPYFRQIGSSFIYIYDKEPLTILSDLSLSEFDIVALESEIEMRLGRNIRILGLEQAGKDELKEFLTFGIRLYPKQKDN